MARRSTPNNRMARWLLLGLVVYMGVNLGRLILQEARLLRQGQILRQEQKAVQARAQDVLTEIRLAQSPPGIQRLARERLGFGMPGEIPVHFTGKVPPAQAVPIPIP